MSDAEGRLVFDLGAAGHLPGSNDRGGVDPAPTVIASRLVRRRGVHRRPRPARTAIAGMTETAMAERRASRARLAAMTARSVRSRLALVR
jgi:hypothetical protein